jgi:hypothetical protein
MVDDDISFKEKFYMYENNIKESKKWSKKSLEHHLHFQTFDLQI